MLHLEHSFVWCWNLDTSESWSEIPGKFWKCGIAEGWRRSFGPKIKEILHRVKEERNILNTTKRRKANWLGHILRRNSLLKHVTEGKIEGRREVTGRRGRRRKQLLVTLSKREITANRKRCTRYRTLWRTCFGRGYWSVARQTMELVNEWLNK
jgi:hypothetical protein